MLPASANKSSVTASKESMLGNVEQVPRESTKNTSSKKSKGHNGVSLSHRLGRCLLQVIQGSEVTVLLEILQLRMHEGEYSVAPSLQGSHVRTGQVRL